MSIKGPENVPGKGSAGGAEELTEEQRRQQEAAREQADQNRAAEALRDNLSGNRSGTPATDNSGGVAGGGQAAVNGGAQGLGSFGYGGIFGNTTLNVDQQQLNDLTNKFFNFTMTAGSLPFGLGSAAMGNSIGAWFQAIMNCFQFTNTTTTVAGGGNVTLGNGQTVASSSGTTLIDTNKAPEGYTQTATAGVFSKDGKFFKYENFQLIECKEDGSALTAVVDPADNANPASQPAQDTPAPSVTPAKQNHQQKPAQTTISQKDSDYEKIGKGNICKLKNGSSGKFYVKHQGRYIECTPTENGSYKIGDKVYNTNGRSASVNLNTVTNTITKFTNMSSSASELGKSGIEVLDKNSFVDAISKLDKNRYTVYNNGNSISIIDKNNKSSRNFCSFTFDESGKIKRVDSSNNYGSQNVSFKYNERGGLVSKTATNSYKAPHEQYEEKHNNGVIVRTYSKWAGGTNGSYKPYAVRTYGEKVETPITFAKLNNGQNIPQINPGVSGYSSEGGEHISFNGGTLYKNDGGYRFVKGGITYNFDSSGRITKIIKSENNSQQRIEDYSYTGAKCRRNTHIISKG